MRLRDDIDPAKTWIISDTHFGHANINDFANRPPDHESLMLDRIASNVGPDDTLLHLGDLCYSNNAAFRALIAPHITGGRKLLIPGNHDKARYSFYKKCGFKLARPFFIAVGLRSDGHLHIDDQRPHWIVSFSHYPWDDSEEGGPMKEMMRFNEVVVPGDLRIHGHIHTAGYTRAAYVPFLKNHINVSVEQTNYQPVRLDHLLDGALRGTYPEGEPEPADVEQSQAHVVALDNFKTAIASHGR